MTASLYQSALSGKAGAPSGMTAGAAATWVFSRNTEDVRRELLRVELHEVAPPVPCISPGGEEIVEVVGIGRRAVEIDMARLGELRIEVHAREDQVVALLLRIADELVVVGRMEAQRGVGLQRRICLS